LYAVKKNRTADAAAINIRGVPSCLIVHLKQQLARQDVLARSCWRLFMRLQPRLFVLAAIFLPFTIPSAKSQTTPPAQFVTATPVGATPYLNIVGTADFNGDGRPDILVVASTASGSMLAVLLQNSDGTFAEHATTINAGSVARIADVNGDGKADVVTVTASPQSCGPPEQPCTDTAPAKLDVYLGNGDGTFRSLAAVNIADGAAAPSLLVADLNGDGDADVAVTVGDDFYGQLQILLNDGTGVFHLKSSSAPAIFASLLAAGDFRGNGKVDLAVANQQGTLQMLAGAGDGTFTAGASYAKVFAGAAAVADFNRDGHLDLVVVNSNHGLGPAAVLIPGTSGGLSSTTQSINASFVGNQGSSSYPMHVSVGDFNHDGYPDVAFSYVGLGDNNFVAIFPNTGSGSFANSRLYSTGAGLTPVAGGLQVADLNGDGNLDLLTEISPSAPMIAFGDKAGNFAAPVTTISPATGSIVSEDFNGDGKADIAVVNEPICNGCNSTVSVYPGSGQSYLGQGHTYPLGVPYAMIAAGDVNGDGKMDLVVTRAISPTQQYGTLPTLTDDMSVLIGNGDGTFQPAINSKVLDGLHVGTTNTQTYLLDVNHDNKLDLVGDWGVALGNGDGSFKTPTHFPSSISAIAAIVTGDFNKDGNLDIIVAQSGSVSGQTIPAVIYTLLGDGKGAFPISHQELLNYSFATINGMVATDLNGDGVPDLAYIYYARPANPYPTYNRLLVQMGKGDGTLATAVPYALPTFFNTPASITAEDFNRDGNIDLMVFAPFPQGDAGLIRGTAGGKFSTSLQFYQVSATDAVALDLNSDGAMDIAGTTPAGILRLMNTGNRK
jgi:hypothetical protein